MKFTKEQQKKLDETKMFAVAGLSLKRPIREDVRWAVEKGFIEGLNFSLNSQKPSKSCSHEYLRNNPDKDECICGGLRY